MTNSNRLSNKDCLFIVCAQLKEITSDVVLKAYLISMRFDTLTKFMDFEARLPPSDFATKLSRISSRTYFLVILPDNKAIWQY